MEIYSDRNYNGRYQITRERSATIFDYENANVAINADDYGDDEGSQEYYDDKEYGEEGSQRNKGDQEAIDIE